jgi:hypothetical protein
MNRSRLQEKELLSTASFDLQFFSSMHNVSLHNDKLSDYMKAKKGQVKQSGLFWTGGERFFLFS